MMKMEQKERARAWKQVKKDYGVFHSVTRLIYPKLPLDEPYDKTMARLSRKTNADSLIRIAKGGWSSSDKEENIPARKIAIRLLGRMDERLKDEKINATLLEIIESKEKEMSNCALDCLPTDAKEERIESLIKMIENEDDSTKRLILFVKLSPFMDEKIAGRILEICEDKDDKMMEIEVLHFLERLSLN